MFVSRSMTIKVITVKRQSTLLEARSLMDTHDIRHLPVIDDQNNLEGIITDRDLRSAMPIRVKDKETLQAQKPDFADLKVEDFMSANPVTISPIHTIQDALLIIQKETVGACPVIDENGKLKGILSVRDLLRTFINVLGIGEPGTLICVLVEEKVGQLKKIVDAVTEENISFGSVLVARYWEKDKRALFLYLLTNNVTRVKKKMKDLNFEVLDPMQWYLEQLPKADQG
ncbi:MAG: CBS domain-containing protein [Desulfobacteraceae bacterium]|nr:CBS domain-containing protein [Desulfobacteraceae bacterium]